MTRQRPVNGSAQAACHWLSAGSAVTSIAKAMSITDAESIELVLTYLRTGGLTAWSMAFTATYTAKDTGQSKSSESRAIGYLTDQIHTDVWRELTDPENGEVSLNWQAGVLRFSGQYRYDLFAGISPRTDLYSIVTTKIELVGIHFSRSDIEDLCAQCTRKLASERSKRAGRPKGAGAIDDSPHLEEMARIIKQTPNLSVRAAAKLLEPKAIQRNSTGESTVRRLVEKFNSADVGK